MYTPFNYCNKIQQSKTTDILSILADFEEKLQEEKVFRAKKSVMEANRDKRAKPSGDNKNLKREETPLDKTEPGNLVNYHNI